MGGRGGLVAEFLVVRGFVVQDGIRIGVEV